MLSHFGSGSQKAPPGRESAAAGNFDTSPGNINQNDEDFAVDSAVVKRVQAELTRLGFQPGAVDGIPGKQTASAIRRFQRTHRLQVNGEISPPLLMHLEQASPARTNIDPRPPVNLAGDELPAYQTGTTFIYSNGDVERVSRVEGVTVRWVRQDGTIYSAPRNFLLPWSFWSSDYERGKTAVSEAPNALWPLREGAAVTFSAKVVVQNKDDLDATVQGVDRWRCRNDGERETTVPAGTFETVVFVCSRQTNPGSRELVRTWYYAKNVRHYVRFVESDPERNLTRSVDLVAVRPGAPNWPPIVRAALARAIAHALETETNEAPMPWTSSAVNTHVTIEATRRFVGPDGVPCRRFVQIWSDAGQRRHYPALACRSGLDRWEIPGLEAGTGSSLQPAAEAL